MSLLHLLLLRRFVYGTYVYRPIGKVLYDVYTYITRPYLLPASLFFISSSIGGDLGIPIPTTLREPIYLTDAKTPFFFLLRPTLKTCAP